MLLYSTRSSENTADEGVNQTYAAVMEMEDKMEEP